MIYFGILKFCHYICIKRCYEKFTIISYQMCFCTFPAR